MIELEQLDSFLAQSLRRAIGENILVDIDHDAVISISGPGWLRATACALIP